MSVTISLVTVWSIVWGGQEQKQGDIEAAPVVRQAGQQRFGSAQEQIG